MDERQEERRVDDKLEQERRRSVDLKFAEIEKSINVLQVEMALNTIVTTQIRDILTSFKVAASVAKWSTAIGAFFLMCWQSWLRVTGR